MRVQNFREPKVEEAVDPNAPPEEKKKEEEQVPVQNTLDNFNIEDIPSKIIMVDSQSQDAELIVYHAGKIPLV